MVNERELYLVNAEIDSELTAEESAELESALQSSAECRAMRSELRNLASLIEAQPLQEPPAGLAQRIFEQIRLPAGNPTAASRFSLASLLSSFQPAQAGLVFAAGVLLTVGFYEVRPISGASVDLSQVVGAMVAAPEGSLAQTHPKDRLPITGPGLSGIVSLAQMGEYVVLSFDLESTQETEIEIGLAEAGLGFGGIAHASAAGPVADESYEVSGGTLRVANRGRQVFSVFLPEVTGALVDPMSAQGVGGREISVEISTAGAPLFSGVLRG